MDVKDFNSRIIGLLIISIFITIMFLYKLIYLIPLIFIAVLMFQSNKKIFSYISRHTDKSKCIISKMEYSIVKRKLVQF